MFNGGSCLIYVIVVSQLEKLLAVMPKERQTFLFSATMTSKVQKLQRASLKKPVKVEVATKFVPLSFFFCVVPFLTGFL